MRRHEISDDHWDRIKGLLPGREDDPGLQPRIIACSSTQSFGSRKLGLPGGTCPNVSATGIASGGASTAGPGRGFGNGCSGNSKTLIWNGSCSIAPSFAPTSMLRAKKGVLREDQNKGVGRIPRRFFHEDPRVRQWFGSARGIPIDSRAKSGCYSSRTSSGGLLARSGYCGQGIRQRSVGQDGRIQGGQGGDSAQGKPKAAARF